MNNKILVLTLCVAFVGCGERPSDAKRMEAGKLRHEIFKECMNLASKNPRNADDDVADIVESCDSYAYYTANQQLDY